MDEREICAEKIRAVSQRARYRDFYDLFLLFNDYGFELTEIIALVKRKEVRSPISPARIIKNWQVAKEQQSRDLARIYCSRPIEDEEIEAMIEKFAFREIR